MQIARFQVGLKPKIKEYMKMINTFTLGEAFDMAQKAKEPIKSVAKGRYNSQQFQVALNKGAGPSESGARIAGAGFTGTGSGTTEARRTENNPTQQNNPYVLLLWSASKQSVHTMIPDLPPLDGSSGSLFLCVLGLPGWIVRGGGIKCSV
ncbi:hypothetical protein LWI28_027090 [Acer negundo]|uniref:Uncharacterized protein n=1 Tax=Acer negundo TaxID=4023 RepID=A0AAD5IXP2_ACENE|nr:hypothetical protein LWI28_027090 [Acer negundo]